MNITLIIVMYMHLNQIYIFLLIRAQQKWMFHTNISHKCFQAWFWLRYIYIHLSVSL